MAVTAGPHDMCIYRLHSVTGAAGPFQPVPKEFLGHFYLSSFKIIGKKVQRTLYIQQTRLGVHRILSGYILFITINTFNLFLFYLCVIERSLSLLIGLNIV